MKKEVYQNEAKGLNELSSKFQQNFTVKKGILYAKPNKHKEAMQVLEDVYNVMSYTVMNRKGSIELPGTYIDAGTGFVYFKRGTNSDVYKYMVKLTQGKGSLATRLKRGISTMATKITNLFSTPKSEKDTASSSNDILGKRISTINLSSPTKTKDIEYDFGPNSPEKIKPLAQELKEIFTVDENGNLKAKEGVTSRQVCEAQRKINEVFVGKPKGTNATLLAAVIDITDNRATGISPAKHFKKSFAELTKIVAEKETQKTIIHPRIRQNSGR